MEEAIPKTRKKKIEPEKINNYDEFFSNYARFNKNLADIFDPSRKNNRKYSKKQVRDFLNNPLLNEQKLRDVSQYMIAGGSILYKRLMEYFATIITMDYYLAPVNSFGKSKAEKNKLNKNFIRAVTLTESMSIKHTFQKITKILMEDGIFFGYKRETDNGLIIQRIPSDWCRLTSCINECWNFAFNFSFFDSPKKPNSDEKITELTFENFPPEFKTLYGKYKATGEKWQDLDNTKTACFKSDETLFFSIPPFVGIYDDIIDLDNAKELKGLNDKLDTYKLLVQKIPMMKESGKANQFAIDAHDAKEFHNNIKRNLPDGVELATTPMELSGVTFDKSLKDKKDVKDARENVFESIGVSGLIMGTVNNGSIGLNRSIEADVAAMSPLLRQYERWFKRELMSYNFRLVFLDISPYNRAEYIDQLLKTAQFGYSKMMLAAAQGMTPGEFLSMCVLENEVLDLTEMLIPLQSSHTATGTDKGDKSKSDSDLSDEGIQSKDKNKNENSA